jgi:hypothetical protein
MMASAVKKSVIFTVLAFFGEGVKKNKRCAELSCRRNPSKLGADACGEKSP